MSLLVTGTDTEVGKTVVGALLLLRYSTATYWKPVATGSVDGRDTADIERWTGRPALPEFRVYRQPVSPHLAARLAGEHITRPALTGAWKIVQETVPGPIVVEGIGGVMVPFNERGYFFADFARDLRLPALVVARSTLGTINHTLLTLEALRERRVPIAGVVMNGPRNPENRQAIEVLGRVPVIAEVEPLKALTRRNLARTAKDFDRAGHLRRHLS